MATLVATARAGSGMNKESSSILVNCGGPEQYAAAITLFSKGVQIEQQNQRMCYPIGFEKTGQGTNVIEWESDLHCSETLPFALSPPFIANTPCVGFSLTNELNDARTISFAMQRGYKIVLSSVGLRLDDNSLAILEPKFTRLKQKPYSEIISIISKQMLEKQPTHTFAGLFINAATNLRSTKGAVEIEGQGPVSLWEPRAKRYVMALIYSAWRHAILVIGAPNEQTLYDFTSYAPGMLAIPIQKKNLYSAPEQQPDFFQKTSEARNAKFMAGIDGNSYLAPQIAGYAARISQNFSSLDGYAIKALIYSFSIAHQQIDEPNGPKKGQQAGIRFLGRTQQKQLAKAINISSDTNIQTRTKYAQFCYEKYEASGFDNTIYDEWLQRYSQIEDKLSTHYQEWERTRDRAKADAAYNKRIENFFAKHTEL